MSPQWEYNNQFSSSFFLITLDFDKKVAYELLDNCINEIKHNYDLFSQDFDLYPMIKLLHERSIKLKRAAKFSELPDAEELQNIVNKYADIIDSYYNQYEKDEIPQINAQNEMLQQLIYNKKIIWNGQKNALTDIFRQLKNMNNSENEPLINNSYEDIAAFLKNNFVCFENVTISTILGSLKKKNDKLKQTSKIQIECKSD